MIKLTGVKATSEEMLEAASKSELARGVPVVRVQGHWLALHEKSPERPVSRAGAGLLVQARQSAAPSFRCPQ